MDSSQIEDFSEFMVDSVRKARNLKRSFQIYYEGKVTHLINLPSWRIEWYGGFGKIVRTCDNVIVWNSYTTPIDIPPYTSYVTDHRLTPEIVAEIKKEMVEFLL